MDQKGHKKSGFHHLKPASLLVVEAHGPENKSGIFASDKTYRNIVTNLVTKKWKGLRIYFGTKAKKVKVEGQKKKIYAPNHEQPKLLDKDWMIVGHYYIESIGKWVRFREKLGINYGETIEERTLTAEIYLAELEKSLYNGYIPTQVRKYISGDQKLRTKQVDLITALDLALDKYHKRQLKGEVVKKSYQDARSAVKLFKWGAVELGYAMIPVSEVETFHCNQILEYLQEKRGFKNVRFNKIRARNNEMFGEMRTMGLIKDNPLTGLRGKKPEPKQRNMPFTTEERKKIAHELPKIDPDFYFYFLFRWFTGMRKTESLKILIEDIDIDRGVIAMPYDGDRRVTKTQFTRYAIIPPQLKKLLLDRNILVNPSSDYLFSKGFLPGSSQLSINTPTNKWKEYVKDGLKVDKDMYAHKGTAGDQMIKSGIDRKDAQRFFGWDDEEMASTYFTLDQIVTFDKIREHIPDFLPDDK